MSSSKLVFLDESSVNCGMTPHYGRALANKRVKEYVPDARFEKTTVISSLRLNGKAETLMFKGAINGEIFTKYISDMLAPTLKKGDILILDNLSVHKVAGALDPVYKKGASVLFLPPYSPDYSPIELGWSKMKNVLRMMKPRTFECIEFAMKVALKSIALSNIKNWFRHCGYVCQCQEKML